MKYLIIKTENNNDYNDQDAAYFLIDRNPEILECYEKRLEKIKAMVEDNLVHASYWEDFQILKASFSDVIGDETAVFRDLTSDEYDLYISNAQLNTSMLCIKPDGGMSWKAYGKDSGTEFWADDLNFEDFKRGEFIEEPEEAESS